MSKITALRLLAIAPTSVKSFVRKPRKIAEPVRRAINMLSSKDVDLSTVFGRTKKIIPSKVAKATAKAINFLQEQDISLPKLVRGAIAHGMRLPTYGARAVNSGARRLVNRMERSGLMDAGDAARFRYAIETEGAKSRQKWSSPHSRDYEISLALKPDEIVPTDFRPENQGNTIESLIHQMQEFDEDVPQKVKREINREIKARTASSTQHQQKRREESKTKEQERAQARIQQALKDLQPIRTVDAQGKETVDASRLKHQLEEFIPVYDKHRKLGIGSAIGGLGVGGTAVGYLFSKRQPTKMSKMMGGKSGRMGKELVGADGEKGRYFQKSRTAKRMTHKFYEVDKPHEPQMKAMGMGKLQKSKLRGTLVKPQLMGTLVGAYRKPKSTPSARLMGTLIDAQPSKLRGTLVDAYRNYDTMLPKTIAQRPVSPRRSVQEPRGRYNSLKDRIRSRGETRRLLNSREYQDFRYNQGLFEGDEGPVLSTKLMSIFADPVARNNWLTNAAIANRRNTDYMRVNKMQKRGNVRERITEFASPRTSPIKVQGYSVSRSYTTKRSVNKSNTRMARKIHEIDAHNYYGEEKMKKPNTFRKNAMGNPVNIGGSMTSFMPNTTTMPRRPMVQRTMPHAKTPTPMGMRPMNPMNRVNNNRFTAYPTARSMATGMPPTMRGGFGKRGR